MSEMPQITQALVARGYSEADLHKILGGNFLRVCRETFEA
jgi:membrane dipeptidase